MRLKANLCLRESNGSESKGKSGRMHIVVSPNHAQLAEQLGEVFANDATTRVIVERRSGERRKRLRDVGEDLRKADRRQGRHQIIEAVIDL